MKYKSWSQAGLLQHTLTLSVVQDGQLDFFQDMLVGATVEGILAPSGDMATLTGEIFQVVRKTDGANMRISCKVHVAIQSDHSNVVVQVTRIEILVEENI